MARLVSPVDSRVRTRVDLRSDTVTTPTPEMRRAMADAEVGDDVYGEDPTVNRLQSLAASLVGKEAALYVPSGTMANQLAIRVLAEAGTEVLCPERAHVYRYEAAAAPVNSSVQMHPLWDVPDGIQVAIEGVAHHLPRPSLVVIENTYMALSGAPIDTPEMTKLCSIARSGGAGSRPLAVHVDGARIWNAAIALGTPPRELLAAVDTVMFCLSKGLSAPVGSLLCGPADVIAEARAFRSRWGGGMRQAGVIAAAGIVALETMVERLADDHARARILADALAARWPGSVDPAVVRTNIVCADLRNLPDDFVARLDRAGVRTGTIDARTFRVVTHKDVDDDAVAFTLGAFDSLVGEPVPRPGNG
jgi:threonine aldolase